MGVGVFVGDGECVGVGVGVRDRVLVADGDSVADLLREGVNVNVGDTVFVTVTVGEKDGETDSDGVNDGVTDGVGDGDGVGQFCCASVDVFPTAPPPSVVPSVATMEMHATSRSQDKPSAAGRLE